MHLDLVVGQYLLLDSKGFFNRSIACYRICVGAHLANQELFLVFASILWAFDIQPTPNEHGKIMTPNTDLVDDGLVTYVTDNDAQNIKYI